MKNNLAEMRPDLAGQWSKRNLPVKPENVSCGSNKVYWWIGPCGHEWDTSVKARSHGEGCPICANARIVAGINDLETTDPDLAEEWSDRNGDLKPSLVCSQSHKKVWWKGRCGHEWQAVIKSRAGGTGCPYCSHNLLLPGFNDLASQYPEVAAEWSDRNLPLHPNQVTAFANRKVWWKCAKGHEWNTLISTRSYGSKCPYCSGLQLLKGFNDFAMRYPALAAEWSPKNETLMPDMVNEKSTKNVWWKCSKCGYEWKSVVKARIRGTQCPVCADRMVKPGYNDLATTAPDILDEWDYEKNTEITPETISVSSLKYAWWHCPHGHTYREKIAERVFGGKGCKVCESEFYRVLPQLLAVVYAHRYELEIVTNNESKFGILLDVYLPNDKLAMIFTYKNTKLEEGMKDVAELMCRSEGIRLHSFPIARDPEKMCQEVRKGFQRIRIYIKSDWTEDVKEARRLFDRIR